MSSYKRKATPGNTDWLVNDRFGMFVHFGLYSMPARHEWVQTVEEMSEEKYQRYFKHFDPDLFDAREWAAKAKAAGMKYAVLTTKHHEGFCLFDSKYTDFKITNTPFGRDLVREYADAFREAGLKVGFYYSLIDWHHPDFPIDSIHPLREHPNDEELDRNRDMTKYAEYMRNQVRELLTNYGKIDVMWFDFSYDDRTAEEILGFAKSARANPPKPWMQYNGVKGRREWEAEKLIALVRELAPEIIVNNRTGIVQDITTPEQSQPTEWKRDEKTGEYLTWEGCHTFSGSWGYNRDESTWKSPEMLIEILVKNVALGGNLIMNVGPTSRGSFDSRADKALEVYADWMHYNSRSIYGCTMAEPEFVAPTYTVLTQSNDGERLYIHPLNYPFKEIKAENLADKIDYAQFLCDGSEILYTKNDDNSVTFRLPVTPPQKIDPVIEIFIKK